MDEQRRMEAQKKLEDEERIRRMREGGEEMRAQLAMEEAQRSKEAGTERGSGLTPEEERRRNVERGGAYKGMGESQQAQMAMWGKEGKPQAPNTGGRSVTDYPAGHGSKYEGTEYREDMRASSGESFSSGPDLTRGGQRAPGREQTERPGTGEYFATGMDVSREGGIGPSEQAYGERGRQERASSGEPFTSGPDLSRERRPSEMGGRPITDYPAGHGSNYEGPGYREDMRASSGESFSSGPDISRERRPSGTGGRSITDYPAGHGSDYRGPGYPEDLRASSGEYFTAGREPYREEQRPVMKTETDYPAGHGSRYGEYRDTTRASTGEYFTSGPVPTGQAPRQTAESYGREAGPAPSRGAPVERAKGMAAGVAATAKGATHAVTEKAKEFNESNRAEDVAARAGETIGKVLRKTILVAKGMSSGLKKGMSSERREPSEMEQGKIEERDVPREHETIQRESTTREYPQGEEQKYQEVRRKEQK